MKRLSTKAGLATLAEPAHVTVAHAITGTPTRFYFEPRPLKGRRGMTKRRYMVPVRLGDPRYADAPFEMAWQAGQIEVDRTEAKCKDSSAERPGLENP